VVTGDLGTAETEEMATGLPDAGNADDATDAGAAKHIAEPPTTDPSEKPADRITLPPDAVVVWDQREAVSKLELDDIDGYSPVKIERVAVTPNTLYLLVSNHYRLENPRRGWYMGMAEAPTVKFSCNVRPLKRKIPRVSGTIEYGRSGWDVLAIPRAELPRCDLHIRISAFTAADEIIIRNLKKGLTVP
jgi:hypothetical protein